MLRSLVSVDPRSMLSVGYVASHDNVWSDIRLVLNRWEGEVIITGKILPIPNMAVMFLRRGSNACLWLVRYSLTTAFMFSVEVIAFHSENVLDHELGILRFPMVIDLVPCIPSSPSFTIVDTSLVV